MPGESLIALHIAAGRRGADRATTLAVLQAYGRGRLTGLARPVNTRNEKFAKFIGAGGGDQAVAAAVMAPLGFRFDATDGHYHPVDLDREGRRRLALAFLRLQLESFKLRRASGQPPDVFRFEDADEDVCLRFGFSCESTGTFDESLIELAKHKGSLDLEEFVLLERTKEGVHSASEIRAAYDAFGLSEEDDVSDALLLSMFRVAANDRPDRLDDLRASLRVVAESRDSAVIGLFLDTGVIPEDLVDGGDRAMLVDEDVPAGLNNIGNTCYLNSLLQFYRSVVPLREHLSAAAAAAAAAASQAPQVAVPAAPPEDGSTTVAQPAAAERGSRFVVLLDALFSAMAALPASVRAVTPERELAELALGAAQLSQVGSQQDVGECMENVVGLLEDGFARMGFPDAVAAVKSLFYGTTVQMLAYTDASGKSHRTTKEEAFLFLIVGVSPSLHRSLDEAFRPADIEYDGRIASRSLWLEKLPPVLTFTINRVQYDQATGQPRKSHQFLRFPDRLFMDRYLAKNAAVVEQRRRDLEATHRELRDGDGGSGDAEAEEALRESAFGDLASDAGAAYQLHAVFVHEGEAQYGHYRLLMRADGGGDDNSSGGDGDDVGGRWLEFDDGAVRLVRDATRVVFGDTTGSLANAYCLLYVRADATGGVVGLPGGGRRLVGMDLIGESAADGG
ncbi:ubiquitin-specific protease ubp2, partial [Cladochytrium tenue]